VKDREALKDLMNGAGGFAYAGYCGEAACETAVKEATKATIRVLPDGEFRSSPAPATCVWCGGPAVTEAVWAKAY
jgi:prolyl-tRNA synthetase